MYDTKWHILGIYKEVTDMKEYEKPMAEIISFESEGIMTEDIGIGDTPGISELVEDWGQ